MMGEYEERFERMEEEMQETARDGVSKASILDTRLASLQREVKDLREEKELTQLSKEKHINELLQRDVDSKKRIAILEKNIRALIKDKNELEAKVKKGKKMSVKFKQWANQEVQTDVIDSGNELMQAQEYASLMKEELTNIKNKLAASSKELSHTKQLAEASEMELRDVKERVERLAAENEDLKTRREAAAEEIRRLNMNLLKQSSRSTEFSAAAKRSARYSSEAVLSLNTV
eukprot:TRINITY_DN15241_c0_g4_i1.p2 TRINITY_DN15241_c0_g4~~TRINITY_DN15241_c0_g4_i1.p2  ORF type:complete len:232 (-),score=71.06 TRINITY_DN15241_c0_g4_i1:555-1250(-)